MSYHALAQEDLQLRRRNLPVPETKDDVITRLEADDAVRNRTAANRDAASRHGADDDDADGSRSVRPAVLDRGVIIAGDVVLSVARVDLLKLRLKLLLCGADSNREER